MGTVVRGRERAWWRIEGSVVEEEEDEEVMEGMEMIRDKR